MNYPVNITKNKEIVILHYDKGGDKKIIYSQIKDISYSGSNVIINCNGENIDINYIVFRGIKTKSAKELYQRLIQLLAYTPNIVSWSQIVNNPTTFPTAPHEHEGIYEPVINAETEMIYDEEGSLISILTKSDNSEKTFNFNYGEDKLTSVEKIEGLQTKIKTLEYDGDNLVNVSKWI